MIPEGGAKCFERKSLKVFSVELALGPLEKISREYLSRNTNTHLPQVLLLQVHRCCLASALIPEEIQHRFNRLALARKLPLEETSPRSKASRPPLDTGLLLLTETERKPIPRRVRSIVNIDSLHQSCPLFRPISYRLAVSSEREREKKKWRIRDSRMTKPCDATRRDHLRIEEQTATFVNLVLPLETFSAGLGVLHQPSSVEFCRAWGRTPRRKGTNDERRGAQRVKRETNRSEGIGEEGETWTRSC